MAQKITHNPSCRCYYNLHKTHVESGYLSYTGTMCAEPGHAGQAKNTTDHELVKHS